MAKARAIVKRRQSVKNIRKITRTMELIANARFRKALDRAVEAEAFTSKIAEIVADLGSTPAEGGPAIHPLLERRDKTKSGLLLVLTSNRGLAGGYNSNVLRLAYRDYNEMGEAGIDRHLEVSGKRGIGFMKFRGIVAEKTYTKFEDKPQFAEVAELADRYIQMYLSGEVDRVQVAYTQYQSMSRQDAVVQTLLPMTVAQVGEATASLRKARPSDAAATAAPRKGPGQRVPYEFLPDARSILEELVPISFKVRLFKCFLDAAVSEQIARMVAMRGATENADDLTKSLTRLYNRARQQQITRELAEIIGGAAALE
jgi:F-type H+-transporting ATPase subunit gamma